MPGIAFLHAWTLLVGTLVPKVRGRVALAYSSSPEQPTLHTSCGILSLELPSLGISAFQKSQEAVGRGEMGPCGLRATLFDQESNISREQIHTVNPHHSFTNSRRGPPWKLPCEEHPEQAEHGQLGGIWEEIRSAWSSSNLCPSK